MQISFQAGFEFIIPQLNVEACVFVSCSFLAYLEINIYLHKK